MNIKVFFSTVLFFCSAYAAQAQAVSFTADAIQVRGEAVSQAKMYWLDGDVRFEYTENGVPMAQIFDNKNNKIIWLDNENKLYLERDMPASERVVTGKESQKTNNPCQRFVDAECVFLKKIKLKDRETEKWLITLSHDGEDFHIFQWIDIKYKNILRQENADGTGLNVDIEDDQKVNDRNVRKLTMVAFSSSGAKQQGIQWYDNTLDIVVKQQYSDDVVDELQNIKVGKVSNKLFQVPEGYILFDANINTAEQQQTVVEKIEQN